MLPFVEQPYGVLDDQNPGTDRSVSGTVLYDYAVDLTRGEWIAPLSCDVEFLPHHLELLLAIAVERRAEVAYGALERIGPTGAARYMFAFPPESAQVAAEQAIYLRALGFFEHDPYSRRFDETTKWTLLQRMWTAGARMATAQAPVTLGYASSERQLEGDPEVNLRFRPSAGGTQALRVSMDGAKPHERATVLVGGDALEIITDPEPWEYAVSVPLPELSVPPLAIRATIVVSDGRVGVALLRMGGEVAVELFFSASDGEQVAELPVTAPGDAWRLLVRNHALPGSSRCTLRRVECIVEGPDERFGVAG